jgi:hypothetical protein
LNQWQFDFVGQHDNRGWGDQLLGNSGVEDGNALAGLFSGDLNEWRVGVELAGAIGNRRGHLAVRNAELNLVRDRALLLEQQRQITHDLNAAYTEVDRSMAAMKTSFNSLLAVQEELEPKRKRVKEGQDQVFFLLDAEQRSAAAESAVHRSVVDYNLALMNYSVLCGEFMTRYNVMLTEGMWSEEAQQNAARKAGRYPVGGPARHNDVAPVSAGQYPQQSARAATVSATTSADEAVKPIPATIEEIPGVPGTQTPGSPISEPEFMEWDMPSEPGSKLKSGSDSNRGEPRKPDSNGASKVVPSPKVPTRVVEEKRLGLGVTAVLPPQSSIESSSRRSKIGTTGNTR